jgi:hypothetical protein
VNLLLKYGTLAAIQHGADLYGGGGFNDRTGNDVFSLLHRREPFHNLIEWSG